MATTTSQQKQRAPRATMDQLSHMVAFFYNNPGLAEGKLSAIQGKIAFMHKWEELTEELNLRGGGNKTSEQWQTVWRDLKSRTSIKMQNRRKEMAHTGNKPLTMAPLTELERQIVGLLGREYVDRSQTCADSLPESDEEQQQLEAGNDIILMQPPKVLALFEDSNSGGLQDRDEQQCLKTPTRTPKRVPKRNAIEDTQTLRGEFLKIAKQQAQTMEMLAEAAKVSAEAAKVSAEAAIASAVAEAQRIVVLNTIADTLQKISNKLA